MTIQFDMFAQETAGTAVKAGLETAAKRGAPTAMSEGGMVRHLTETGRYRILRKLEPRRVAETLRPQFPLKGLILDT